MSAYFEKVEQAKDDIIVTFMIIIDDRTLRTSYAYSTNLHIDFGITQKKDTYSMCLNNKKEYNIMINKFKKATGKRIKLTGTDNTYNYTRLLYSLV